MILAGFGAFGSVVGRFLLANGVATTVLDIDSDQVDLMRRLGIKAVLRRRVARGPAALRGRRERAGADRLGRRSLENTVAMIRTARRSTFPNLRILARASTRVDAYEVLEAGADASTARRSTRRCGRAWMRCASSASAPIRRIAPRSGSAATTRTRGVSSTSVRRDDATFESRARESVRVLERLLRTEFHTPPQTDEGAWATEALRRDQGGETQS